MTNKEAIEILSNYHNGYFGYKIKLVQEAHDLAIKALEERDDLVERAYGHIVGQGTKGVIRPDDLTKSEMES